MHFRPLKDGVLSFLCLQSLSRPVLNILTACADFVWPVDRHSNMLGDTERTVAYAAAVVLLSGEMDDDNRPRGTCTGRNRHRHAEPLILPTLERSDDRKQTTRLILSFGSRGLWSGLAR